MKLILSQLYYFILALRPKQWLKNIIVFIPLFFSDSIGDVHKILQSACIFILLSLFIGSTYIFNDIKDRVKDAQHPVKKHRPLASKKLHIYVAVIGALILLIATAWLMRYYFGAMVFLLAIVYLCNTTLYNLGIKQLVILDVFSIGMGFVLRWIIGTFAINVELSQWLLIMLFFGALFLGFLKRYQEVKLWTTTRSTMHEYNEEFLRQIISIITWILLIAYTLYTFNSTQPTSIILTVPIVAFVIIRYYYHIFTLQKHAESIEDIILGDKQIVISGVLYVIVFLAIRYF
jgi:4-hydroxybenzoate polyprenyltransferase